MNAYAQDVEVLEQLLDDRAARLATTMESERVRELVFQIAEVQVAEMRLGVDATLIREIAPIGAITRFPGQPASLQGLVQVRGELMSMVNTGGIVGLSDTTEPRFSVVVQAAPGSIALAVEKVNGFRSVYSDELIEGFSADSRPLLGVTRDFVSILDVPRLVESDAVMMR